MEYMEFSAKTVNDAITNACQHFTVASDKLDYEVVEEGSSGFLGINAKKAVIKARVKEEKVSIEDKNSIKRINAIMLTDNLHPLINDKIIDFINESNRWKELNVYFSRKTTK